jgi:hypothetical protein
VANAARGKPDHDLAVARRLHLYVLDRYGQAELPRDDGSRSLTHGATAPVTKAAFACNRFMRYTEVVGNEPTRAVSQPRWPRVDTRPRSDTGFRLDTAYLGLFYDEAMSNAASPPDGLVFLDFTHTLAGPCCKMLMATSGANVVEIEEPAHGDRPRPGSAVSARGCRCGEMIVRP